MIPNARKLVGLQEGNNFELQEGEGLKAVKKGTKLLGSLVFKANLVGFETLYVFDVSISMLSEK